MRSSAKWWVGLAMVLGTQALARAQEPGKKEVFPPPMPMPKAPLNPIPKGPTRIVPPAFHPGLPMPLDGPQQLVQPEPLMPPHKAGALPPVPAIPPMNGAPYIEGTAPMDPVPDTHPGDAGPLAGTGLTGHPPFYNSMSSGIPDEMYVQIEALVWSRDVQKEGLLRTTFQPFAGAAGDMSFDWDAGLRATVGWYLSGGDTFEVTFMDLGDWNAGNNFGINAPINIAGAAVPLIAGTNFSTNYTSRLDSIEMNYRGILCENASFLCGFRYLYTHENIQFLIDTPISDARTTVRTDNNVFGPQVGGEYYIHCCSNLKLVGFGKLGLGANALSQRTQLTVDNRTTIDSSDDNTEITFFMELGASVLYRFGEHWTLRGGYQMLLLEGLALAPGQLPADGSLRVPDRVNANGNGGVLYHGLNGGLEFRW